MKKKINIKTNLTDSKNKFKSPEKKQSRLDQNYFSFFEHAPIALWIEDFSDVKKYVEEGIKESNLDIKSYITNNNLVIKTLSSLVKIKEVNATAVHLYKAKDKLHLIENVSKVFTEKSFKGFSNLVIDILLGEKESSIITVNKTLDGEEFDVLIKFNVESESNGSLENVIVSAENITNRIISDRKLDTTKNLFSNTLSSIKDGFVILDFNSNYLYINKEASSLLNIKNPKELIGKQIWNEFPEEEGDTFYDFYQKALVTREPIRFENYFKPWDRWFENRIIPSSEGMLIFFHEITDKKVSEDKIKEAYNIINKSSSVAILCKNEWDFPVEFASENVQDLFGYTNIELLSNKIQIAKLVHPEDLNYISTEFLKVIQNKDLNTIKPKSFRITTKKGEVKWVKTSIDTVRNENNEITHIQGITEDITEQKNTEDLLFERTQRLKDQFNNTPLASIMWDLNFKILEWNESAERIFGYTAEELKGKSCKDLLTPPHLIEEMKNLRETLFIQDLSFKKTNENITKSGKIITCEWYSVTLKDAKNNIIGSACLVDDITERVKAKELLEKSEKKYRDIFEKTIDAVLIIKDGFYVDCNESTLKMFGYNNKESLLQLHPSKISPKKQNNGSDSFIKADEMINIALEKEAIGLDGITKKNGLVFPAEVSLTRIDDLDNTSRVHAVVKDISERVKTEELENVLYNISKAALTINNFNDFGMFIKNELHKIIDTNNFYIALYNEVTDMISTPVFIDEKEEVEDFPAKNSLTGYVIKTQKALLLSKNEHVKLIKKGVVGLIGSEAEKWLGVPLKINDKVFGAIVVQSYNNAAAYNKNDVNLLEFVADQISTTIQRKKAENELTLALKKAQESDKLKSSFLANMSHEIRTPMNGIIGFSELFLEPNLSEKERNNYAEIVINSSKQLLSIVNDILDISKIEAGVVQLDKEDINLNKLFDEIYGFYKPKAKENNLEFICVKGLENTGSFIEIDKTKLNQILTNLLSNAFKFTDIGSIKFGYKLVKNNLQFFVKDTGVGIEKNIQDKIFDRFIQANIDLSKKLQGTGLGLAISKKFVELFNGEIWVDSNNNGTTIYFTIPHVKSKSSKINSIELEVIKPQNKVKDQELTILVAEDEEYNMMYINELFSKTNFKIIEADNGEKAVELAKIFPEVDLVLMDIKMPIMDGYEAMKQIKKQKPLLPVVALSAFAMESDKRDALREGFDAYLTKPIDKNLLFNIIGKYTN